MSKGKGVKGAAAPKAVERKGPMTNPSASKQSAPAMKNSNKGSSSSGVAKTESESATRAGFKGESIDLKVKDEGTKGHTRNSGSALRGGSSRNASHDSGNRFGK